MHMKITINELRRIIREEIEAAHSSNELNEGWKEKLAAAAITAVPALGAGALAGYDELRAQAAKERDVAAQAEIEKQAQPDMSLGKKDAKEIIKSLKPRETLSLANRLKAKLSNAEHVELMKLHKTPDAMKVALAKLSMRPDVAKEVINWDSGKF